MTGLFSSTPGMNGQKALRSEPDLKWKYGYLEATRDAILEARCADEKIGGKLVISQKRLEL